ncbi:hypothetical protein [Streptomonospora litoralis]|uniref:DUF3558 domain-containing protein n=1 Tax=Streptomonospora litoralis TaxID=2498135 RepID=A0A4P6Q2D7_9ACTN|nr:hypothetical protein [Streptomonospora litoralis]QBI52934.1 hypothetical protein EKD16_05655 [Streptomonospora litoralis]
MSGTSGTARSRTAAATAAAAGAALVLLASGCGLGGSGGSGAVPSPDSTYSNVVAAAEPAPPADGLTTVEVQGIKIGAPKNWSIDKTGGQLCMRPPGQGTCGYGAVQVIPHVAENDPNKWPKTQFDSADGWASDPSVCRSLGTAAAGDVPVTGAEKLEVENAQGLTTHADGLKSHHREWKVSCQNGDTFEVRLWFLPQSDIAVYVWSVDAQYSALYDKIAKSMNTDGYERD